MKKLLLILLATLSMSAIRAASVSWSDAGSISLADVDYSKTVTVEYIFTVTSETLSTVDASILSITLGGTNSLVGEFDAGGKDVCLSIAGFNAGAGARFSGDTYTFIYVLNLADQTGTITLISEGGAGGSVEIPSEYLTAPSNSTLVAETILNTAVMASSSLTITYTSTVPEPTVLALLALGVAGLALKRRI